MHRDLSGAAALTGVLVHHFDAVDYRNCTAWVLCMDRGSAA